MLHSDLEILHETQGRIRVRLPEGLSDPGAAGLFLCGHREVRGFRYNPALRTAVIWYKPIGREELLARIAAVYARQNGMRYIHLKDRGKRQTARITPSGQAALAAILVNTAVQVFLPASPVAAVTKWCAVGTTAGAVIEHGYHELAQRGAFDPEVMSIMYLINAMGKGQTAYATPLVWLITFGRHLFRLRDKGVMLKVEDAGADRNGNETTLVRVLRDTDRKGRAAFLGEFLGRYLQAYPQMPFPAGRQFVVQG